MNIERARTFAAFLRTVKPSEFDMGSWYREGRRRWWRADCGTTACAGGWACMITEFQRAGLILEVAKHEFSNYRSPVYIVVGGKTTRHYDALAQFFELSPPMTRRWFDPETYFNNPTLEDVVQRIEEDIVEADAADSAARIAVDALAEAAKV